MPGRTLAHATCMSVPLLDDIVYGPVRSRRLGVSLGVNLLPAGRKTCNMDCAYCHVRMDARRRALPRAGPWMADGRPRQAAVEARLTIAAEANEVIDRLTLAGHGEPTLHPEFEDVVVRLRAVRDRIAPRIPIAIFSNSTTAAAPDIRRGLSALDERYMKLDAGDAITFADVNGGGRHLSDIIDGLRLLRPITIQAMFVRDSQRRVDNSGEIGRGALVARARNGPASVRARLHDRSAARARNAQPGDAAAPARDCRARPRHRHPGARGRALVRHFSSDVASAVERTNGGLEIGESRSSRVSFDQDVRSRSARPSAVDVRSAFSTATIDRLLHDRTGDRRQQAGRGERHPEAAHTYRRRRSAAQPTAGAG